MYCSYFFDAKVLLNSYYILRNWEQPRTRLCQTSERASERKYDATMWIHIVLIARQWRWWVWWTTCVSDLVIATAATLAMNEILVRIEKTHTNYNIWKSNHNWIYIHCTYEIFIRLLLRNEVANLANWVENATN